jgi:hypothetical protein
MKGNKHMKTIIHIIYPAVTTATRNLAVVAALILIGTAARTESQTCTAPSDMAAWWKLEETSGATAADAVGGNDGTYMGSPLPTTGRFGNALSFDGNDAVSLVGQPVAVQGNAARSIFAWVRTTYYGWQAVVATGTPAYSEAFNLVVGFGGFSGVVGVMGYSNDFYPVSGRRVFDGAWHLIGATYDGAGTLRTYVDGNLDNITGITYATYGQNNYIGQSNHLGGNEVPFRGEIDEVMIFDRAVTPCEIAAMYGTNQPPLATDDFYGLNQAGSLTVPSPGVLANDTDPDNNPLTVELISGPAHATSFHLNPDGSFSYTPPPYFYGEDTFTYRANDGVEHSQVVTVHITVSQPGSGGFITGGGNFLRDSHKCTFGFAAKVQGAGAQGNLEFQDRDANKDVKSQVMQVVYAANSIDGYFGGTCRVNGAAGYTFFVQIHDRGEPGRNDDLTIWIFDSLNNIVYTAGGLLSGGNIVIHEHVVSPSPTPAPTTTPIPTATPTPSLRRWWCDDDLDGAYMDYGLSATPPPTHLGCIDTEPSYIDYCDTDPSATAPCP